MLWVYGWKETHITRTRLPREQKAHVCFFCTHTWCRFASLFLNFKILNRALFFHLTPLPTPIRHVIYTTSPTNYSTKPYTKPNIHKINTNNLHHPNTTTDSCMFLACTLYLSLTPQTPLPCRLTRACLAAASRYLAEVVSEPVSLASQVVVPVDRNQHWYHLLQPKKRACVCGNVPTAYGHARAYTPVEDLAVHNSSYITRTNANPSNA